MSNAGCLWDREEDLQLVKLYVKYKLNTSLIADIHKRSIKSIELRIIKLGLPTPENKESETLKDSEILKNSETLKDNNFIWEMAIEQEKIQKEKGIRIENRFQFFSEVISKAVAQKTDYLIKIFIQSDINNKQIISNLEKKINELEQNQLNSLD